MITDEMLRQAAQKANEVLVQNAEHDYDPEHPHTFSPSFEKKMKGLVRKTRHQSFYKAMQRVAAVFLALLIGSGIWLSVDAEAREAALGWIKEKYADFFVYRFSDEIVVTPHQQQYRLKTIPDGYTEFRTVSHSGGTTITYANKNNDILRFGYIYDPSSTAWFLVVDNTEHSVTEVNGCSADLFTSTSEDVASTIMWIDPSTNVAFEISAFVSTDELIEMAKNIEAYPAN